MRILYTSDLHGNQNLYQQLIDFILSQPVDVLLIGGDFLPRQGHNDRSLSLQQNFINQYFKTFISEITRDSSLIIALIPGNNDWKSSLSLIDRLNCPAFYHLHPFKPYFFIPGWITAGYPFVPPTPFSPKDFERRDLKKPPADFPSCSPVISQDGHIRTVELNSYFSNRSAISEDMLHIPKAGTNQKSLYIMHSPPFDTSLDKGISGQSLGSRAIRSFIESQQPSLTLHGHIHESPKISGSYWHRIGPTVSINPGQFGDQLSAVYLDINHIEETLTHTQLGPVNMDIML